MEFSGLPKTKAEAIVEKSKHYFTGVPCSKGHVAKRYSHDNSCFECKKEGVKKWREQKPARVKELNSKYNKSERKRSLKKIWQEKNRDKINEQNREWHAKNPDRAAAKLKKWKSKNVEVCRTHCRNRKARLRDAEGSHTKADIDALYAAQNGVCAACKVGLENGYHVDHKNPIARGGANSPDNLQLLCKRCNQTKHAKDYLEWCAEMGYIVVNGVIISA